ncbi:unnamed protein product [Prunus armeniaca]|uniref:Uncharacterized protein n=1 Tax=Prunus armeniaca TaxID=36596 RepID=A0A6J5VXT2_PRUAR|nr:unnamed protein product [Prunus armeniaca]
MRMGTPAATRRMRLWIWSQRPRRCRFWSMDVNRRGLLDGDWWFGRQLCVNLHTVNSGERMTESGPFGCIMKILSRRRLENPTELPRF